MHIWHHDRSQRHPGRGRDVIHRAHQVVNRQAVRRNTNEEITSAQEKDHGKETK
jgi:hypothetical protein